MQTDTIHNNNSSLLQKKLANLPQPVDFDEGDLDVAGMCKNLLNKNLGLSDLNVGRSAYLTGVLKPYKDFVESLQRIDQPEQHLTTRRIRKFYM